MPSQNAFWEYEYDSDEKSARGKGANPAPQPRLDWLYTPRCPVGEFQYAGAFIAGDGLVWVGGNGRGWEALPPTHPSAIQQAAKFSRMDTAYVRRRVIDLQYWLFANG